MIDALLVGAWEGGVGAASCAGDRLEDFVAAPADGALEPGAIHLARVGASSGGLVFATIVAGEVALERGDAPPRPGETIVVQITAHAREGKPARASRRIALEGALLVLLPGGKHASASRRVGEAAARRGLAARARIATPAGFGVIARAAAADADAETLAAEAASLAAAWRATETRARGAAAPVALRVESAAIRAMRPFVGLAPGRIVCADAGTARVLCVAWPMLAARVTVADEGAALFDRCEAAEMLDAASRPRVALAEGAALTIERTAALTAIDVDAGPLAAERANLLAAGEIGRQLRLREIVGPVVVDFVRGPAGQRRAIEQALARGIALDRRDVAVLGWTKGGLLELARAGDVVD